MAVQQPVERAYVPEMLTASPNAFRARKSLPHPQAQPQKRDIDAFVNEGRDHSTSPKALKRTDGKPMPGTFPAVGLESSLPPTPPHHKLDQIRSASSPIRLPYLNGTHASQRRSLSSGDGHRAHGLQSPGVSPPAPAGRDLPVRPPLGTFSPSSRADSFRTAREEQYPSDDEEQGDHVQDGFSGAVKPPQEEANKDRGLGLDFERDDDSTPTPKKLRQAAMRNGNGRMHPESTSANSVPNREWDTNMMRNVTVRRKKRPVIPQHILLEDEERVAAREIVPKLFNGSSEEEEGSEPLTPSNDHFAQTMPSAQRSEERPKRYSGSSHTSTVLEALIVPTSPPRRRALRHVSKTLSLRSDDGPSRPRSSSNHALTASDELSAHQLHDRLRAEHFNRVNGIYTPDPSGPTPPIALKHHAESRSLRADGGSSGSFRHRRASDGMQTSSPQSHRYRTASGGHSHRSSSGSVDFPHRLSFVSGAEPKHVKYDAAAKRMSNHPDPVDSQLTRAATRKALQRMDSSGGTIDARPSSFPREIPRSVPNTASMVHYPREGENAREEEARPDPAVDTSEKALPISMRKTSIDHTQSEPHHLADSIPRVSFDQSTIATSELHRASNASNLRADSEHANARHIFAQSTPFSQVSEHEIGEANAITIYPHNNNSLLVVQQVARPSGVQKQTEEAHSIPGWPTLTVQPATPPQQFSAVNVDSPLKNPREPPLPPIINIHPATPASELETSPLDDVKAPPGSKTPVRSMSLKEKARRYSDNMMRPIVTRTSSLRRSYYRRSRAPRSGAPRDSVREGKAENTGLHPFWQPRGFWDEYSDSDSESDWGEPEPAGGSKRLPAGGDTTTLGEPKGLAKVLDRTGFSRGFLIGNSLGLERAGTNKKKPMIQLPVGLGQRTSGRVVMKRNSQGTLHTIGSESLRSARVVKRVSVESLRELSGSKQRKAWDPRNWQVQYVGVGGMRDMWRQKQAEKRRRELKGKIGMRYSIEGAPTSN